MFNLELSQHAFIRYMQRVHNDRERRSRSPDQIAAILTQSLQQHPWRNILEEGIIGNVELRGVKLGESNRHNGTYELVLARTTGSPVSYEVVTLY